MVRKPPEHFFEQIMKKPTKAVTTSLSGLDRMLDWLGDHTSKVLDYKSLLNTKAIAYLNQKGNKTFYDDKEAKLKEVDALFSIGLNTQEALDDLFKALSEKGLRLKCVILVLETLDYQSYFKETHLHLVHDESFVIDQQPYKGLVFSVYEN